MRPCFGQWKDQSHCEYADFQRSLISRQESSYIETLTTRAPLTGGSQLIYSFQTGIKCPFLSAADSRNESVHEN